MSLFYKITPLSIVIIISVTIIVINIVDGYLYNRKRNYLEKIGFERRLYHIPETDGPGKYAFKRHKDIKENKDLEYVEFIYENTLDEMSYKEIKRRYK